MIPSWIIEKIRERERTEERPSLPIEEPILDPEPEASPNPPDRGVVVIDL